MRKFISLEWPPLSGMASFKSKDWFIALLTIKKFHAYTFTSLCKSAVITWLIRSLHCTKMIPVSWYRFGVQFFFIPKWPRKPTFSIFRAVKHYQAPQCTLLKTLGSLNSISFLDENFLPFCLFTWLSSAMISTLLLFHSGSSS